MIGNASEGVRIEFGYAPVIGGTTPAERNVISGNGWSGIMTQGTDVTVIGNYIGTDRTGLTDRGNASNGLLVNGTRPTIGGTSPAERNVIAGNNVDGIQFGGSLSNGRVQGNLIGVGADGSTPLRQWVPRYLDLRDDRRDDRR